MNARVELSIQGQTLVLRPERAVWWVERRTLIVADTHFGKSGIFRRHGLAVPSGSDERDRERLSRLVAELGAQRLMILGDFVHAPLDEQSSDARDLKTWALSLRPTTVQIIAGNHDRGERAFGAPVIWQENEHIEPPFCFVHDQHMRRGAGVDLYTLSGHVHPVARLRALRKTALRVPVFWEHSRGLILPSFGIFTGGQLVRPAAQDRLFAAAPERVVPLSRPPAP